MKPARKAIAEFPVPTSTTDVRSWFGLVNQVAYTFSRADTMAPFRDLLKPATKFTWTTEPFEASKQTIIEQIQTGVEIFEKNRTTCIATDWVLDIGCFRNTAHAPSVQGWLEDHACRVSVHARCRVLICSHRERGPGSR